MNMPRRRLGKSPIEVSAVCLGSMTWGTQNTSADAFAQIDMALEHGVDVIDTAELYPTTPLSADTQGRTEAIIGEWFARSGRRDAIVLATKVAGHGHAWIQDGRPLDGEKIRRSLEQSLRRLQTDYVDLYQLHWPNRGSYHFRGSWDYDPSEQDSGAVEAHMVDVLETLGALVREGAIREVGLSNETCWGTMRWLAVAERHGLPRMVSIQNEYSLLHRLFDLDLAELAHHESVGLLAFSPLAAGLLSGKYRDGIPAGSRRTLNPDLSGRVSVYSEAALAAYLDLAEARGLEPAALALAFCLSRPFMTSVIIGATDLDQLATNLSAVTLTLDNELQAAIAAIHRRYPIPM